MRSFDEWFDENCDGSDLAKDACRKLWDEFSDQINIICRKSYEKQQSKVDELLLEKELLQNKVNLLTEALDIKEQLNQKLREREGDLQKKLNLMKGWENIAQSNGEDKRKYLNERDDLQKRLDAVTIVLDGLKRANYMSSRNKAYNSFLIEKLEKALGGVIE